MVHEDYSKRQANRMNQARSSLSRAFKAELIKIKRTGLLWMCIAAADFIPIINSIAYFFIELDPGERAD